MTISNVPAKVDPALKVFLQQVKTSLEGATKKVGDVVTRKEMNIAGWIDPKTGHVTRLDRYDPAEDGREPPAPSGFAARGTFSSIILRWEPWGPNERFVSHVEIWRNTVDDLPTAALLGVAQGAIYADSVPADSTYYYWIRGVSYTGRRGPWAAAAGLGVSTARDPARVLEILQAKIETSHLNTTLNARIKEGEDANTALVETNSKVAGLEAQYTVKVDANGHVAGFGVANTKEEDDGTNTSLMLFQADRFGFTHPSNYWQPGTAYSTGKFGRPTINAASTGLVYEATTGGTSGTTEPAWPTTAGSTVVDGTVTWTARTPASRIPFIIDNGVVYIDTAMIKDATITNAQIKDLSADKLFAASGTIADAVIGTGHITNAMIGQTIQSDNFVSGSSGWRITKDGTAEFRSGYFRGDIYSANAYVRGDVEATSIKASSANIVDTLHLRGHAVTVISTYYSTTIIGLSGAADTWEEVASRSIDFAGAQVDSNIAISVNLLIDVDTDDTTTSYSLYARVKRGTTVLRTFTIFTGREAAYFDRVVLNMVEAPGAGTHTYSVEVDVRGTSILGARCVDAYLALDGAKR